jgi:N-acetylneuraminic acid mutarotase
MNGASLMLMLIATGQWARLAPLPDREGFAGMFAGVSHGVLIAAGGANFAEKKPWEGGTKSWYDTVYVLDRPDGQWKVAGKLPRPLAYGASVTFGERMVCVGGSDASRHYADAFALEWKNDSLTTVPLPSLASPLANASWAMVGHELFIAGGLENPDDTHTTHRVYRMDLAAPDAKWEQVQTWPGSPRMLAVAAGFDGSFFLAGGVDLHAGKDGKPERSYLRDAYRYEPGKGWTRIADLPRAVTAAPSPAPVDRDGFYILGGDDGLQIGVAPGSHRGFRDDILRYDAKADRWIDAGKIVAPRVTAPCVRWNDSWVVPSGEIRPGVRSPDVMRLVLGEK